MAQLKKEIPFSVMNYYGDKRKMNEEELFCKLFPEYVVNGKPLSPYFDLFESGYEQAENRIAELEKENAETKERIKTLEYRCENIKDTDTMELVALQRENAELKEKLGDVQMQKAGEKSDLVWKLKTANEQKADQLTKAKEIIKYLLSFIQKENYKTRWDINITEAEQFLNSEEEK